MIFRIVTKSVQPTGIVWSSVCSAGWPCLACYIGFSARRFGRSSVCAPQASFQKTKGPIIKHRPFCFWILIDERETVS